MKTFCVWCLSPIKVKTDFSEHKDKAYCCPQCYWADWLFCNHYSDDNTYLRNWAEKGESSATQETKKH